MERRKFFPLAVMGTTTLLFAGNFLESCSKDSSSPESPGTTTGGSKTITIDLSDPTYASLTTAGNSVIKENILIIHASDDSYTALTKICTHQGCTVGFNGSEVVCPCHGSKFSSTGAVINGPATLALKKYKTELSGTILTITT